MYSWAAICASVCPRATTTAVARKLLPRAWHLLTDAELAVPATRHHTPAPGKQRR